MVRAEMLSVFHDVPEIPGEELPKFVEPFDIFGPRPVPLILRDTPTFQKGCFAS